MTAFHQTFGLAQHQVGNLHMAVGGLVEGRCNDLGVDAACHIGHLLGALVDEQDNHVGLGVVLRDGIGDFLQEHRLTGLGLGDDESALALADGREHIHHAL